ncbi:FkbM family methyltransferase [Microcoleus sp. LEGE 07076]|uniref:FkbM family methyltransferase n=1 Tax=Microcoleus sp. LEGE 07076 TaxID=915322 RepID=UPI001880A70B|nr:FkbM family methyltransferase [Microcoleus sp. LEGE 07076]MBE9186780.1 FkbM family methyltransferase [Microcoleus sp. LEGE 07076]
MKIDFPKLCQQHNITPRGIISIGAYDGKTLKRLNLPNTVKTLLIDANPTAVERLQANFVNSPNTQVVQAAIANHNDTVTLHLTSLESSSSILPWQQYSKIYPNIKETQQLTLPSRTLDTLLEELDLSPTDFNILILDIQGAELLALEGATQLLNTLDAIYTTVHYQELFKGGALAEQVDQFLTDYQFQRVAEETPYHPAWGEAFYVRQTVRTEDGVLPVQPLSPTSQLLQATQQELETLQLQYQETLGTLEQTQDQLQQKAENLAELESQRDQILAELEQSQSQQEQLQTQLQQTQTDLKQSQSQQEQLQTQLQQTQTDLKQSQSQQEQLQTQLQQTQKESDQSRSELHEVREELELTQFQLDEVQVELEQYVAKFHQQKEEITKLQTELEQTKTQLTQVQPQPELTVSTKSKSDNAAIVKLLAKVLAETLED